MGCGHSDATQRRLDVLDTKLDELLSRQTEKVYGSTTSSAGLGPVSVSGTLSIGRQKTRRDGRFDAFVSHSKKLPESEDRAVWVADVLQCMGYTPFFDRSNLTEITENTLTQAMLASDTCVTVIDPVAFHSEWVFLENRLAYNHGIPIIPIYDADRYRWQQLNKWKSQYEWAFTRQAVPINKDQRQASVNKLLAAVSQAKEEGRKPPPEMVATSIARAQVQVGSGGSRQTETLGAVDAAHKAMCSKLTQGATPSMVIATFTCVHDGEQVAQRIHELCPNVPMIGCTTCRGVVQNSSWVTHNKEYAVGMWCICDDGGTYTTIHIESKNLVTEGLREQVKARVEKALEVRCEVVPSFVVILGSPRDEEIILEGLQQAVGRGVPILGGSSADNDVSGKWQQIAKEGISSFVVKPPSVSRDGITILVAWASCEVATTLTSGFRQTVYKGIVTKVDDTDHGRTIMTIDGKPAKEVYEKWTSGAITKSVEWKGDMANVLAPSSFCPLGECYGGSDRSYVRVMHPASLNKSTGALTTFADARVGMQVTLLDAAPETLARKISESAQSLIQASNRVSRTSSNNPVDLQNVVGAFMIFCGGLAMAIDDMMDMAVEQLAEVVGQQNTMGICCFGEQGMSSECQVIHGNLMFGCLLFSSKPARQRRRSITSADVDGRKISMEYQAVSSTEDVGARQISEECNEEEEAVLGV